MMDLLLAATQKPAGTEAETQEISGLRTFFIDQIKDICWSEKYALKDAMPAIEKAATSPRLREVLAMHAAQTEGQIERLYRIFDLLGEEALCIECEAIKGVVRECEDMIRETQADAAVRDAALILAARKIEHYEIATYDGLAQLARTLGEDEAAKLLETTLDEEKRADAMLAEIAMTGINDAALHGRED